MSSTDAAPLLKCFDTLDAFVNAAVSFIKLCATEAVERQGVFRMALAGGSTPKPVYARLAQEEGFTWPATRIFFGDERAVPPDDGRSNYRMARESLFDLLPHRPAAIERIEAEINPEDAARRYEQLLQNEFSGQQPHFDLVILGMGTDGHIASLFPCSSALKENNRLVLAVPAPFMEPQVPRITLALPVINAAHSLLVLIGGAEKLHLAETLLGLRADIVQGPHCVCPDSDPLRAPASLLRRGPKDNGTGVVQWYALTTKA